MTIGTYDLMFAGGLVVAGLSLIAIVVGNVFFSIKKKDLNKTLRDRYGY